MELMALMAFAEKSLEFGQTEESKPTVAPVQRVDEERDDGDEREERGESSRPTRRRRREGASTREFTRFYLSQLSRSVILAINSAIRVCFRRRGQAKEGTATQTDDSVNEHTEWRCGGRVSTGGGATATTAAAAARRAGEQQPRVVRFQPQRELSAFTRVTTALTSLRHRVRQVCAAKQHNLCHPKVQNGIQN